MPTNPNLSSILAGLRRLIRTYVWVEGLAVLLLVLGFAFWFSLGFDWVFEPPAPLRVAVIVAVVVALTWALYRYILRRAFVSFADRSMALLLERRFKSLNDSLITMVELADHDRASGEFNSQMLAVTEQDALSEINQLKLSKVFNLRPLVRRIGIAMLLLASVIGFGIAAKDAFGIWMRRSLLLSDELWPRKTRLVVDGFEQADTVKVARGSDVELSVRADAAPGRLVPEIVEVRYTSADGARVRENMSRQGDVRNGNEEFQPYAYVFRGVLSPIEFHIRGGDDRRGPFKLEVVDSPTINDMTLHCEFPAYTERSARDLPVSGIMAVPVGTKISLHAVANKDLREVQIDSVLDGVSPETTRIEIKDEPMRETLPGKSRREFDFTVGKFESDALLLFTLSDTDGIKSREPVRLAIRAVLDEPPQVAARLTGIGTAITPQARLPFVGDIADDYAVNRAWIEFHADEQPAQQQPFAQNVSGKNKLEVDESLEVGPLELKPAQKLHLLAYAADKYDLAEKPNVGASQKYVLDVVTPAQLRSILEARELQLRRRFETIVQEFTDTRDLLARIDFVPPSSENKPSEETKPTSEPSKSFEPGDDRPSDSAAKSEESADQLLAKRKVQTARVTQNSNRTADETLGLAQAFDEIRAELINNRVDTEELKKRLTDGISDPLKRIAAERLPKLREALEKLETAVADPAAATPLQDDARRQADQILVEMKQVLDNMLELETFNEALDLLRSIIKSQEELNDRTKQKQKSKLRELLED